MSSTGTKMDLTDAAGMSRATKLACSFILTWGRWCTSNPAYLSYSGVRGVQGPGIGEDRGTLDPTGVTRVI